MHRPPRRLRRIIPGRSALAAAALGCLALVLSSAPPARAAEVVRIGTAGPGVLVVVVETGPGEATPETGPGFWRVDGAPPADVGRWSYPWDEGLAKDGYPIVSRHHIYLEGVPLRSGRRYRLATPYGPQVLDFDDDAVISEAIHVNQVAYSDRGGLRFANLGVFLGDLGARHLAGPIPYEVLDERRAAVVLEGLAVYHGDDTGIDRGSGEHVWRLDLSALPPGGPYHVRVPDLGRSHPFRVGGEGSRHLADVLARGLYHQRCGMALEEPFTLYPRGTCHGEVTVTDARPPDLIKKEKRGPRRRIAGGYHDAGDFDRRLNHTMIPAMMLNLYDAFPSGFRDGASGIPESGNGIPDWLDECLWGLRVWEELQEPDGAVRAGTETEKHPAYGRVNAATDRLPYRTYRRDGHATASAAGLFAQASRLVRPFDPLRAEALLGRAEAAWRWVRREDPETAHDAQRMYAALQLYLATGDPGYHLWFLSHAIRLTGPRSKIGYEIWPSLEDLWGGAVIAPYFYGYLITDLPTDPGLRSDLEGWLREEAEEILGRMEGRAYPLGPRTFVGGGSVTGQGRYAEPLILLHRLTGERRYLDAVSQLADYAAGLNPLNKTYATGIGASPPTNPLHLDSYFSMEWERRLAPFVDLRQGLDLDRDAIWRRGPVPGIVIYGPTERLSERDYQKVVWEKVHPPWMELPEQRRYSEGWSQVRVQEFTTRLVASQACLYAFLAYGDL